MTKSQNAAERGVVAWLMNHRPPVPRLYGVCVALSVAETVALAPGGDRNAAVLLAIVLLPTSAALVLLGTGAQIVLNPIWGPAVTRGFMGVLIVVAPLMVVASLILYPTAPDAVRSLGNGAATGWCGVAWAAQYLYERHGLRRSVAFAKLWSSDPR